MKYQVYTISVILAVAFLLVVVNADEYKKDNIHNPSIISASKRKESLSIPIVLIEDPQETCTKTKGCVDGIYDYRNSGQDSWGGVNSKDLTLIFNEDQEYSLITHFNFHYQLKICTDKFIGCTCKFRFQLYKLEDGKLPIDVLPTEGDFVQDCGVGYQFQQEFMENETLYTFDYTLPDDCANCVIELKGKETLYFTIWIEQGGVCPEFNAGPGDEEIHDVWWMSYAYY